MKKTLIALAALASVSAFAQSSVTISGKFGVAYQAGLGGKSNIAVTDGDVNFASTEDLGGGMKAGATIGLRTRGRENTVSVKDNGTDAVKSAYSEVGRDATVWVSGDFGKLTAGSIELGNGITGLGWGGANVSLPTDINNGGLLSANAYANVLVYTAPTFNGVTVSVARADSIGTVGHAATSVKNGVETDQGLTANVVGATYVNGPLSVFADYTKFGDLKADGSVYDGKRTRLAASYDFGVAKVGYGVEDNKGTSRDTTGGKQTTFGVSVPMGALTIGAVYAKSDETSGTSTAVTQGTAKGFGADYSLSKRTVINMSWAKIDRTDGNAATTNEGKEYRVRLMHSF